MSRILLSGDSHCDINHLQVMSNKADMYQCDKMFVLGDFGWWPKDKQGLKFIDACSQLDYPLYFLPGNHEDWGDLEKHEQYPDYNDEGFIEVASNVFYAPTGFRWEWDGIKFLSVGGAYSIDRKYRTKFISWFPQEIITDEDMKKIQVTDISLKREMDVILSHDAPAGVDMAREFATTYGGAKWFDLDPGTARNMERLRWACDWWKPTHLYHGHWHLRYTQEHQFYDSLSKESYDIMVTGLNCNQSGGEAFHVLDTKDIK